MFVELKQRKEKRKERERETLPQNTKSEASSKKLGPNSYTITFARICLQRWCGVVEACPERGKRRARPIFTNLCHHCREELVESFLLREEGGVIEQSQALRDMLGQLDRLAHQEKQPEFPSVPVAEISRCRSLDTRISMIDWLEERGNSEERVGKKTYPTTCRPTII